MINTSILNNDGINLEKSYRLCMGSNIHLEASVYRNTFNAIGSLITQPLIYQWQKDNVDIPNTTNQINLSEVGNYTLKVKQNGCIASANLNVSNSFPSSPKLNYQEQNNFCEGSTVLLLPFYASDNSSFQWQKNSIDISGAINKNYYATETGDYRLKITDLNCPSSEFTNSIKLKFGNSLNAIINATETVLCGNDPSKNYVYLTVLNRQQTDNVFSGPEYPFSMKLQKNGVDIPNLIDLRDYKVNEPGNYRLAISQGNCTSYSVEIPVLQSTKFSKPVITTSFENTNFCDGSLLMYSNTQGNFYKDNLLISNSNSYYANQTGTYKFVRGVGTSCEVESDQITINKGTLLPVIKATKTVLCGPNDVTNINYNSLYHNASFNFQWQRNGIDIPNSTSNGIVVFGNQTLGTFRVKVTNGNCTEYSNEIVISQNNAVNINISLNNLESSTLGCTNRIVKIASDNNLGNSSINNWYKNGILITGENNKYLYTNEAGEYQLIMNINNCTATSNTLTLQSDYVPQPTLAQSITYLNTSSALQATGCNGTINWYDSQTSTTSLGTGTTFNTPNIMSSVPYYADCTSPSCKSARKKIDVKVEPCAQMITIKSGNWDDPAIWSCNRIPFEMESVNIANGHTVSILSNYKAYIKSMVNNGAIIMGGNSLLEFKSN